VDDVAWGALTLALTLLGGGWTAYAFRNRGLVSGLRGAGLTLIPLALLLTNSLRMVSQIVDAVGDWTLGLAWNPFTWLGLILGGVSVVCFVVAGFIANRGSEGQPDKGSGKGGPGKELSRGRGGKAEPVLTDSDPEIDEIEALLRRHGIT
jgi:hypothetical protein